MVSMGSHAAWERIYAEHRRGLFALALTIARCSARAEDAVHEAFVRLWSGRDRLAVDDPVAYAYAAVRRAAIDQVRRAVERPRCQGLHHDDVQPDQRLIEREAADRLRAGLDE